MMELIIPPSGIGYTLSCGCSSVHTFSMMTRIPTVNYMVPCEYHHTYVIITSAWSNL